jgi:uncharacterized membrane protein (UPF0127 family)
MPWLLRDGHVLAAVEMADGFGTRLRGLLGRDEFEGAYMLQPARSVHTIGMRFPIDVAYCDRELVVLETVHMSRFRVGRPRLRARAVIEAQSGAFDRWGLGPGDHLEISG